MPKWITRFPAYLWSHKLATAVIAYVFISALLEIFFQVDICLPCLWKMIFHKACPGCGLTTAFIQLLQGDFVGAFHTNFLLFIVIPAALYYVVSDYYHFIKGTPPLSS